MTIPANSELVVATAKRSQRGFSLVEIAVVLVIVGLALGTGIAILQSKIKQGQIDASKERAAVIQKALTAYVALNNRMPCPAAPGIVRGAAGYNAERTTLVAGLLTCTNGTGLTNNIGGAMPFGASRGTVPCQTIGVPEEACTDAWGSRFTYVVTNAAVQLTANTVGTLRGNLTLHRIVPPAAANPVNALAATGNQINACSTTLNDNSCNQAAVAMVISHGANQGGGFATSSAAAYATAGVVSAYELVNTANGLQFIQNDYVETGANSFDDIVMPFSPSDVVYTLSQSGSLKSANVLMNERFETVKLAIIQQIYASATGTSPNKQITLPAETSVTVNITYPGFVSFTGCTLNPPADTQVLPTVVTIPALTGLLNDVWVTPIRYKRAYTPAFGAANTCVTPFVLVSYGPDRAVGGSDDIFYPVTQADITSAVVKIGGW